MLQPPVFHPKKNNNHENVGTAEAVPRNFSQDISIFSTNAALTHGSLHATQVSTSNTNAVYGDANEDSRVIPSVTTEDSILVDLTTADKPQTNVTSCFQP